MKPIYERLGGKELLKRCLRGGTQNANESLHAVIWSRCPKVCIASRDKAEVATLVACSEFNMGSVSSHNILSTLGFDIGTNTKRLGRQRDKVRHANSRRSSEKKFVQRRESRRRAHLEERRRQQLSDDAYIPGGY